MATAGHGLIVAEYFDIDHSRTLPWGQRPMAAALLAEIAKPDRRFDTIVIGESQRAYCDAPVRHYVSIFAGSDSLLGGVFREAALRDVDPTKPSRN